MFTESYHPYISGVVNSIDMIKRGLEENGHEVYIVTLKLKDNSYTDENIIRFKGFKYPFKSLNNFYFTLNKRSKVKQLKKYNFDLVHIHTEFSAGRIGVLYSKKYKTPLVYTFHTNYEDYFEYISKRFKFVTHKFLLFTLKRLIKFYYKRSDYFIVPTAKVVDTFNRYKFNFNVNIIPTGIDLDMFCSVDYKDVDDVLLKYNIKNKFIFCSIGRISSEKSIDVLINAFYKANVDNAILLICGGGPELPKLIELVNELKISDKVIFTNSIDYKNIPVYYNLSNVFLNASCTETQGLTYIEALASNLPIIVKKDKALDHVLKNRVNGFEFETSEELIECIKEIVNDEVLYKELKCNCYKTVSKFDRLTYSNKMEEVYNGLIKKNR